MLLYLGIPKTFLKIYREKFLWEVGVKQNFFLDLHNISNDLTVKWI